MEIYSQYPTKIVLETKQNQQCIWNTSYLSGISDPTLFRHYAVKLPASCQTNHLGQEHGMLFPSG